MNISISAKAVPKIIIAKEIAMYVMSFENRKKAKKKLTIITTKAIIKEIAFIIVPMFLKIPLL